jgi:hypothetical protein
LFEFREGRWRVPSTERAAGTKGPLTWYSVSSGETGEAQTVRTDTVAKSFTFAELDGFEAELGEIITRVGFQLLEPRNEESGGLYASTNEVRPRGFVRAEGPLLEALEQAVRATFPSVPEMGRQLNQARYVPPDCKNKEGWVEELAEPGYIADDNMDPFRLCARGTTAFPLVCYVRMVRKLTLKEPGCTGWVSVEAWVLGTPERLKVVHTWRDAIHDPKGISGQSPWMLFVLEDRFFALTSPLCYEGCGGGLSLVEVDARGARPVRLSR